MEDREIIALFFQRSENAIAALSDKYGSICMRIATNILKNRQDSEECVNDAYLGAWNTIPPQNPDPLLSYICRIVRNLAVKRYHSNTAAKRNSVYDTSLDELENCFASFGTVEEEMDLKALADLIYEFLATLEIRNRVLFVRRYWYADSISDLAKQFHMTNHGVSVRLFRIRESLKQYLEKKGEFL